MAKKVSDFTPREASTAFSALMRRARKRMLTAGESRLLVEARQRLRALKKPRPNKPRKLTRRRPSSAGARYLSNPAKVGAVRIGRVLEVRYHRDRGRLPGLYKHVFKKRASVWTMPDGSVVIA